MIFKGTLSYYLSESYRKEKSPWRLKTAPFFMGDQRGNVIPLLRTVYESRRSALRTTKLLF